MKEGTQTHVTHKSPTHHTRHVLVAWKLSIRQKKKGKSRKSIVEGRLAGESSREESRQE